MPTVARAGSTRESLILSLAARRMGAAFAILMAAAGAAPAQDFPGGRPVEMTVMFGAGSAADVTARYLAEGMAKTLGVPVPVVNRTGGGGAIGYSHVQQQATPSSGTRTRSRPTITPESCRSTTRRSMPSRG
jgi:tripartite-type tricarboxylate transporter receptor subunit TctC